MPGKQGDPGDTTLVPVVYVLSRTAPPELLFQAQRADNLLPARVFRAEDFATDDQAIQAALNILPAWGGLVVLGEGDWTLTAGLSIGVEGTILKGSGWGTLLIGNNALDAVTIKANRCTVRDLAVKDVDSGVIVGAAGFTDILDCRIENVWVSNFDVDGVAVYYSSDFNRITGCRFDGNASSEHGAIISGGAGASNHNIIEDCVVRNLGTNDSKGIGIGIDGGSYANIIRNNDVYECGLDGIRVAEDEPVSDVFGKRTICHGNYVENAHQSGIAAINPGASTGGSHEDLIITDNIVINPTAGRGIFIEDVSGCIINNNIIAMATAAKPIEVDTGGGNGSSGIVIEGNKISASSPITITSGSAIVRNNQGHVTEKFGIATLANGTTSIVVTHGLDVTPEAGDIMVTPMEAWGAMGEYWIDTYTATQFTIHSDIDPTQDVDFAWKAIVL